MCITEVKQGLILFHAWKNRNLLKYFTIDVNSSSLWLSFIVFLFLYGRSLGDRLVTSLSILWVKNFFKQVENFWTK